MSNVEWFTINRLLNLSHDYGVMHCNRPCVVKVKLSDVWLGPLYFI